MAPEGSVLSLYSTAQAKVGKDQEWDVASSKITVVSRGDAVNGF